MDDYLKAAPRGKRQRALEERFTGSDDEDSDGGGGGGGADKARSGTEKIVVGLIQEEKRAKKAKESAA